jgi:hypothetical protein
MVDFVSDVVSFNLLEILIFFLFLFALAGRVVVINNNNAANPWIPHWIRNMVILALLLGAGIWIFNKWDLGAYERTEHVEERSRWHRELFD